MRLRSATTADEVPILPVHDAPFDPGEVRHDTAARTVVIPFVQEAIQWDSGDPPPEYPQRERVRETAWFREYKVPLLGSRLTIRNVESVMTEDHWGSPFLIFGIAYDPGAQEIVIESDGEMRVRVTTIDVVAEMTPEPVKFLRRRVIKGLGAESDSPWK